VDRKTIRLRGLVFTKADFNVSVVYKTGWATVPPPLERAAVEIVAWRYKEKDRIAQSSKGVGQETVSFSQDEAPKDAMRVLDQYRNVVPA
jgi:hypothetical protein